MHTGCRATRRRRRSSCCTASVMTRARGTTSRPPWRAVTACTSRTCAGTVPTIGPAPTPWRSCLTTSRACSSLSGMNASTSSDTRWAAWSDTCWQPHDRIWSGGWSWRRHPRPFPRPAARRRPAGPVHRNAAAPWRRRCRRGHRTAQPLHPDRRIPAGLLKEVVGRDETGAVVYKAGRHGCRPQRRRRPPGRPDPGRSASSPASSARAGLRLSMTTGPVRRHDVATRSRHCRPEEGPICVTCC